MDRREFVRLSASAGAALSLPGLTGCDGSGASPRAPLPLDAISGRAVERWSGTLSGTVIRPGDDAYEASRRVWNGRIDVRPGMIVRCADVQDVQRCVDFVGSHDLILAVRGGGHSAAGHGTCEGGLVIDLSRMKGIAVDPESRVAYAQPGVRGLELDTATQGHGLSTVMPECPGVGVGGYTLGGGQGMLSPKHGLGCDNLLSAEVVLADGTLGVAGAEGDADLLWALRGGGGNFGIVTAFEYRVHEVGDVWGGDLVFDLAEAGDVLRAYRDFLEAAPRELMTSPRFLSTPDGVLFSVHVCWPEGESDAESVLDGLRALGAPAADTIGRTSYLRFQASAANPPAGLPVFGRAGFFPELQDAMIDALVERVSSAPSGAYVSLYHLHGAISEVSRNEAAFPLRDEGVDFFVSNSWQDPSREEAVLTWVSGLWEAVRGYTEGAYVNGLADEGAERVREAYGSQFERLSRLKSRYDPRNLFRSNQNIPPA